MRSIRFVSSLLITASFFAPRGAAQTLQPDPQLTNIIESIRSGVNGSEALDFVLRIYERDRWANFAKFQESAAYIQHTMTDIGLRNVELGSAPADGVSQFGFWTMPLAWDVKGARLEVVEPAVASNMRVLADYDKEPASLIMWSGATPPGGTTAEVVELRPSTLDQLKRIDVIGKMVLTDPPRDLAQRGAIKAALFKMGAAGMISYATENANLPGDHYWMNAWGDHGWGYTKQSSPLVGFSITPLQGEYLSDLLAQGAKVRVKAVADTRTYSGRYPYITGVIPGIDSEEEVLELGHGFELGAQDNATGVAAMLEAVAVLQRLISAGELPRPKRSIRVLIMAEDYGSSAYIAAHLDRMRHTIGAICVDAPAGPYDEVPAYSFIMNPDVSRSYQDALIIRIAESYYAGIPGRFPTWTPYRARSDSFLSDPTIGVPTISLIGNSGATNIQHNSADTIDRVDPRSLRDMSALLAGYLYCLASAGDRNIPWLAQVTYDRGLDNARRVTTPYLNRIAMGTTADALGSDLYAGLAKIDYNADRDLDALVSVFRLASADGSERLRAQTDSLLQGMRRFVEEQGKRLHRAADERAAELGINAPVRPLAPPMGASREEAAQMIVKRKRFGPVTLDDLPLDQREGYPGFGGNPAPLPLLLWCDGKRNLAEVIRLTELEYGPMDFDFVGYFKFLARHGYIDLLPSQ